jgi:hypothetical protein
VVGAPRVQTSPFIENVEEINPDTIRIKLNIKTIGKEFEHPEDTKRIKLNIHKIRIEHLEDIEFNIQKIRKELNIQNILNIHKKINIKTRKAN